MAMLLIIAFSSSQFMTSTAVQDLKQLACSHKPTTDKVTSHSYEMMYGLFLMPLRVLRNQAKVFEIGLGCTMKKGAGLSARLWRSALPEAELWEAEVDPVCLHHHEKTLRHQRIRTVVGDQSNVTTLRRWLAETGGAFNAIIDDGSHENRDILTTFSVLWPSVKPGGVYFIEDLQVGRHHRYDDSEGHGVVSDVIQAWIEQLLIRRSMVPPTSRRAERLDGDVSEWRHARDGTLLHEMDARALAARNAHPLPDGVAFIFCQFEACVIGKDNTYPLKGAGCSGDGTMTPDTNALRISTDVGAATARTPVVHTVGHSTYSTSSPVSS